MQQRKNVIFIADSLDNAHKFQAVLSSLDVDVAGRLVYAVQEALGRQSLVRFGYL